MNDWLVIIFADKSDADETEVLRFRIGENPLPNIGETVWYGDEGNGYQVEHKHFDYQSKEVRIYCYL